MPSKPKTDLSRWNYYSLLSPEGFESVQLKGGVWFPQRLEVFGRYKSGPMLTMVLTAEVGGEPVLRSLTIGQEDDDDGPAAVTATAVHELPIRELVDETIAVPRQGRWRWIVQSRRPRPAGSINS